MTFTLRFVELGLELGHVAELGRADRGEVLGVREQHRPGVADPVVELDRALGGVGLEVGCGVVDDSPIVVLLLVVSGQCLAVCGFTPADPRMASSALKSNS